jgi:hypothetical protein
VPTWFPPPWNRRGDGEGAGRPFDKGAPCKIMRVRTDRGKSVQKGKDCPGEHEPIVDRAGPWPATLRAGQPGARPDIGADPSRGPIAE